MGTLFFYAVATSAIGMSSGSQEVEKKNLLMFVDHKTDSVIQSTLRNELGADVTILTVAHRLQTIMDADKIVKVTSLCLKLQYAKIILF